MRAEVALLLILGALHGCGDDDKNDDDDDHDEALEARPAQDGVDVLQHNGEEGLELGDLRGLLHDEVVYLVRILCKRA